MKDLLCLRHCFGQKQANHRYLHRVFGISYRVRKQLVGKGLEAAHHTKATGFHNLQGTRQTYALIPFNLTESSDLADKREAFARRT
jgi:hypothetical protein